MTDLFFFHGLESGPHGSKYSRLSTIQTVISPDFREDRELEPRLEKARNALASSTQAVVVGSSFGGLVAAILAEELPQIQAVVLCAPALHRAPKVVTPPCLTYIIHGLDDDVVPIEVSRALARRSQSFLLEVKDGHRLSESLPQIEGLTRRALRRSVPSEDRPHPR